MINYDPVASAGRCLRSSRDRHRIAAIRGSGWQRKMSIMIRPNDQHHPAAEVRHELENRSDRRLGWMRLLVGTIQQSASTPELYSATSIRFNSNRFSIGQNVFVPRSPARRKGWQRQGEADDSAVAVGFPGLLPPFGTEAQRNRWRRWFAELQKSAFHVGLRSASKDRAKSSVGSSTSRTPTCAKLGK